VVTSRPYEPLTGENVGRCTNEAIDRMLADISRLAPDIIARAAEIEVARRMPPDLVETLKSIGVFRPSSRAATEAWNATFPRASRSFER
jgi:hypothetical protein